MISVQEADKIILENLIDPGTTDWPAAEARGRVLREEIMADRAFPPFHRVMMDGIAISYEGWEDGKKSFEIASRQLAGDPPHTLSSENTCIEIMTGAVCPTGCDAVIPIEQVTIVENGDTQVAEITAETVSPRQNIHKEGTDCKKGDILIQPGKVLDTPEIAVAVSVGKTSLCVSALPRIAIVSTGDELVEIDRTPLPYQIRRSNVYALQTALAGYQMSASLFHMSDQKEIIQQKMGEILQEFDLIILSGGVSKGKADYVPEVLEELGVTKLFHRVKQRPGKPFWFGRKENRAVFALPGNPVSTLACFCRYVLPYIQKITGLKGVRPLKLKLEKEFVFRPALTMFLPVQVITNRKNELIARPFPGQGSGDFANLLHCDGFLELEEKQTFFRTGEAIKTILFRDIFY